MLLASDALAVEQRVARFARLHIVRVELCAPVGSAVALGIALEKKTAGGPYLVSVVSV
jgi:hypothetical protein